MKKRLAILAVYGALATAGLLAGQTAPANPPKSRITAQGTGKAGEKQAKPKEGNANAPQSVPVNVQTASAAEQKEAKAEQENFDIQRKLEWFTGILAIVGVLQVVTMIWQAGLLRGTLKEIHVQAGHMDRQTKILEDSVSAAQKSADASLAQVEAAKSTQRAQLTIEFIEPEWSFNEESGGFPIRFKLTLDGTTRAYILDDSIIAYVADRPRERGAWMGIGLPRNLTPEISPFCGDTILKTVEALPQTETDTSKVLQAKESKLTVFLNGRIWYRDIFGDEWVLEIDRYWVPWSSYGDKTATGGMWAPVGSGRYDTHRQVKTNQQEYPKPN